MILVEKDFPLTCTALMKEEPRFFILSPGDPTTLKAVNKLRKKLGLTEDSDSSSIGESFSSMEKELKLRGSK